MGAKSSFPRRSISQSAKLTTHLHVAAKLRRRIAIPPHAFMACKGKLSLLYGKHTGSDSYT